MKINEHKTKERLKSTPAHCRVFIYDASCIMLYLEKMYEPVNAMLFASEIQPYKEYDRNYFKDPKHFTQYRKSADDLYKEYCEYRAINNFTSPIESLYVFKIILTRLRLIKNGWQFVKTRMVPGQTVMFTPLVPKGKMPTVVTHDRGRFM